MEIVVKDNTIVKLEGKTTFSEDTNGGSSGILDLEPRDLENSEAVNGKIALSISNGEHRGTTVIDREDLKEAIEMI